MGSWASTCTVYELRLSEHCHNVLVLYTDKVCRGLAPVGSLRYSGLLCCPFNQMNYCIWIMGISHPQRTCSAHDLKCLNTRHSSLQVVLPESVWEDLHKKHYVVLGESYGVAHRCKKEPCARYKNRSAGSTANLWVVSTMISICYVPTTVTNKYKS